MKLLIMASPLNGSTSATSGMMMSVLAVKAFSVSSPNDGGQSIRIYSNLPDTFSSNSANNRSLAIAEASSKSAIAN